MTQKVDGNFETLRWETSFTDVKDFIESEPEKMLSL